MAHESARIIPLAGSTRIGITSHVTFAPSGNFFRLSRLEGALGVRNRADEILSVEPPCEIGREAAHVRCGVDLAVRTHNATDIVAHPGVEIQLERAVLLEPDRLVQYGTVATRRRVQPDDVLAIGERAGGSTGRRHLRPRSGDGLGIGRIDRLVAVGVLAQADNPAKAAIAQNTL
jgi:hypothetical protein